MRAASALDQLNPEQRQAVLHGHDPLLVIAGAGTGKTNTLAHRVAQLIADGADPRRILLLTFTRRAAEEMVRRVQRICGQDRGLPGWAGRSIDWAGTFHAVGARLLRQHAHSIGLDPSFTILDREDSADLLNYVRDELDLADQRRRFPQKGTCLAIYSHAVNAQQELSATLLRAFPWCEEWEAALAQLFSAYVEAKQRQNLLDYDDLLLYWAQMMEVPELAELVGTAFDHVLVDEYQDTNALQAGILRGLKPDGRGLTVVGDDCQAIYSFRAATVRNILDFPGLFEPPAAVVTLERNYRSTQPILAASNAVIAQAGERFTKTLSSERPSAAKPRLVSVMDEQMQVAYVADRILAAREAGLPLKSQAVLFRTSHHSGALEIELARRNIPYVKFGGLKFLEAAHIKDILGLLRWGENPRDRVAGFRSLQILPGIGPGTARKLLAALEQGGFDFQRLAGSRVPPAAAADWPAFVGLLADLANPGLLWHRQIEAMRLWYEPHLERLHDAAPARAADLAQLEQIAQGFGSRSAFLENLTLDAPAATSDESGAPLLDEDYLILSTIHSAKGQEWRAVTVLNVVDGCIPSDMATGSPAEIDEERRLLYVAMTRAQDELTLMVPQRFYTHQQSRHGDRHVYAGRSRFITPAMLEHFEVVGWAPGRAEAAPGSSAATPRIDIGARLRQMWR